MSALSKSVVDLAEKLEHVLASQQASKPMGMAAISLMIAAQLKGTSQQHQDEAVALLTKSIASFLEFLEECDPKGMH